MRQVFLSMILAMVASAADVQVSDSAALARALRNAQPGDTIELDGGPFTMSEVTLRGERAAPITIRGGMLDCTANCYMPAWYAVRFEGVSIVGRMNIDDGDSSQVAGELVFDGVEMRDGLTADENRKLAGWRPNEGRLSAWGELLKLTRLDNVTIRDSALLRTGVGATDRLINAVGVHGLEIDHNRFENCGAGGCIQAKGGSQAGVISWNYLNGGGQRAIQVGGQTCDTCFRDRHTGDFEAEDFEIHDNVIVQTAACFVLSTQRGTLVHHNTCLIPARTAMPNYNSPTQFGGGQFLFRILQENDIQPNQDALIQANVFAYSAITEDGRIGINGNVYNFGAVSGTPTLLWDTFAIEGNAYFSVTPASSEDFERQGMLPHRHPVARPKWTPVDPTVGWLDQVAPGFADWGAPSMRALAPEYANLGARVTRESPAGPKGWEPERVAPMPRTADEWRAAGVSVIKWSDLGMIWDGALPPWFTGQPVPAPNERESLYILRLKSGDVLLFDSELEAMEWLAGATIERVERMP